MDFVSPIAAFTARHGRRDHRQSLPRGERAPAVGGRFWNSHGFRCQRRVRVGPVGRTERGFSPAAGKAGPNSEAADRCYRETFSRADSSYSNRKDTMRKTTMSSAIRYLLAVAATALIV